jgi:hypothetical protein
VGICLLACCAGWAAAAGSSCAVAAGRGCRQFFASSWHPLLFLLLRRRLFLERLLLFWGRTGRLAWCSACGLLLGLLGCWLLDSQLVAL